MKGCRKNYQQLDPTVGHDPLWVVENTKIRLDAFSNFVMESKRKKRRNFEMIMYKWRLYTMAAKAMIASGEEMLKMMPIYGKLVNYSI